MLIPARPLLALLGLLFAAAVAASVWPRYESAWALAAAALLLAALIDAWRARRAQLPTVTRELPHALALGSEREVRVTLEHQGARALALLLYDHLPPDFSCKELPL